MNWLAAPAWVGHPLGHESTKMIGRKLASRLERLEASLMPEPQKTVVLQVQGVSPDGKVVTEGPRFVVSFNPLAARV